MRFFRGERRAASIPLAHGATGWSVIALDAFLRASAALGALGHCGGSLAVFLDPAVPTISPCMADSSARTFVRSP